MDEFWALFSPKDARTKHSREPERRNEGGQLEDVYVEQGAQQHFTLANPMASMVQAGEGSEPDDEITL